MMRINEFFRDTKPFGQLVGLCFSILLGFVLGIGLQLLLQANDLPQGATLNLYSAAVMQILTFLLPTVLFSTIYYGSVGAYLKVDLRGRSWLMGGVAIVAFVLMLPANDWLTYWNANWNLGAWGDTLRQNSQLLQQTTDMMLSQDTVPYFLLQLHVVALVPAICEECFFRGALQQTLLRWVRNPHVAIIATSVIFSLAHGDILGFSPRLLLGLMLGYMFHYSGSILVNICAHFFNNAAVVVLYFLFHHNYITTPPTEPLLLPWFTTVLCTVGAMLIFVQYFTKNVQKDA